MPHPNSGPMRDAPRVVLRNYILMSAITTLVLMSLVGFLNIKNLEENYRRTFLENLLVVAKGGINAIEYGLKYGKSISDTFASSAALSDINEYIGNNTNIAIVTTDGEIIQSTHNAQVDNIKPVTPQGMMELIGKIDKDSMKAAGAQTLTNGYFSHEFIPIHGYNNAVAAYLVISFDNRNLTSKTSDFTSFYTITLIVITATGTILFMILLGYIRTVDENGQIRRTLLRVCMIANITLCQLIFTGLNLWTYSKVLEENAFANTRFIGGIIKKNIDSVISKAVPIGELEQVQQWMTSVLSSAADIQGSFITLGDGKTRVASTALVAELPRVAANEVTLELIPDKEDTKAKLTLVINRDSLNKKLFPILVLSTVVLLASIVAMLQVSLIRDRSRTEPPISQ